MSAADLETVVLTLQIGARTLDIEQIENLSVLAEQSVRDGTDPYWAYLWPSAHALVLDIAETDFSGLRVLEIGAGLGAPGLAAAALGGDVTLSDLRLEALELIKKNAARNELDVSVAAIDWSAPPPDLGRFDRIIGSDVLYEDGMLRGVLRFAKQHLADDGVLLLADPNRVESSGIRGAALLSGFDAVSCMLVPGATHIGGVTLHALTPRHRRFRAP